MRTLLAISLICTVIAVALWTWLTPESGATRTVILERVSNASGMVLVEYQDRTVVATVDEVDQWTGPGTAPPLILFSSIDDGTMVGGLYSVGQFGEVEALAMKNGSIAFPYKTGAQTVILRHEEQDITLINKAVIAQLTEKMKAIDTPPYFFEFEGLAGTEAGWELVCSAVRPNARDTPRSTMAVFRMAFEPDGKLSKVSPPIRRHDGTLYKDYAAALDVLDSDLAIIPGFHSSTLSLVNWEGLVVKEIETSANRVEGVKWNSSENKLYLVRECVGTGTDCSDGVHFGVPLWIVTIPQGLL